MTADDTSQTTDDADRSALSVAMRNADAANSDVAEKTGADLAKSVEEALTQDQGPPPFNSHSQSFAARLIAEERSLRETVGNIDAQIAALNAQRTDAMLAQSGITAALAALQRGK